MQTAPLSVGDVTIEQIDIASLSDEDLANVNAFGNILRKESNPDDPPRPLELTIAGFRTIPPSYALWLFWGRDPDGTIVAAAEGGYMRAEENAHLLEVGISVRPDRRERGVAKAMLGLLADLAERENRTLLMSGTSAEVPAGEAFAKRVGADAGLSQHTNRLLFADVDRDMVRRWVAEGPERAPGYSVIAIDGPYPDDLVEQIAAMHEVMNTAPRDDLDFEDYKITVEHVREWETSMLARGDERWSLFVRHDESGELVGFTEVSWNEKMPKVVWQMGTAVRPDHRGHALGKWIKAAMIERILAERTSSSDEIRTGNADSNDPMLGINTQLGFKPYQSHTVWQVSLEKVKTYLGSSS